MATKVKDPPTVEEFVALRERLIEAAADEGFLFHWDPGSGEPLPMPAFGEASERALPLGVAVVRTELARIGVVRKANKAAKRKPTPRERAGRRVVDAMHALNAAARFLEKDAEPILQEASKNLVKHAIELDQLYAAVLDTGTVSSALWEKFVTDIVVEMARVGFSTARITRVWAGADARGREAIKSKLRRAKKRRSG